MADASPGNWSREPPADPADVDHLAKHSPVPLPDEYLATLRESNGGEGELGRQPGWFSLWRAEDVLNLNRSYEVPTELPGFFGFGSNGGGELLAFDTRAGVPYAVVAVPFIPLEASVATPIAPSFRDFRNLMGKVWEE